MIPIELCARRRRRRCGAPGRRRRRQVSRRRHEPGRLDARDDRAARGARRRHRPVERDRDDRGRRAPDRCCCPQHGGGGEPCGEDALPDAGPRDRGRCLTADPQHGHGRGQPAPAHALPVFLRRAGIALQQARARARAATRSAGSNRTHAILGASSACVATHPSDMCVALAALDAVVHLRGEGGERTLPLTDLHRLPGDHPELETVLEPGELITAIELPALPFAAGSTYRKVRDRSSYAFALVSVAAALEVENGSVRDVRLALGGVATKPWRAWKAEEALRGRPATADSFRAAAEAELAAAAPLRDNAFKVELARRTIERRPRRAGGARRVTIVGPSGDDSGSARAGGLGARERARSADPARAWVDRGAGFAPRRRAEGDGRRSVRRRRADGRHGLRLARLQHDREGPPRDARHERCRGTRAVWCW